MGEELHFDHPSRRRMADPNPHLRDRGHDPYIAARLAREIAATQQMSGSELVSPIRNFLAPGQRPISSTTPAGVSAYQVDNPRQGTAREGWDADAAARQAALAREAAHDAKLAGTNQIVYTRNGFSPGPLDLAAFDPRFARYRDAQGRVWSRPPETIDWEAVAEGDGA